MTEQAQERIRQLERLLEQGQDNAMLRYGLGSEHLRCGEWAKAAEHLAQAVEQDKDYSAAWKLYGQALAGQGETGKACQAYESGIRAAQRRGDKQAEKEMRVFHKRLIKASDT